MPNAHTNTDSYRLTRVRNRRREYLAGPSVTGGFGLTRDPEMAHVFATRGAACAQRDDTRGRRWNTRGRRWTVELAEGVRCPGLDELRVLGSALIEVANPPGGHWDVDEKAYGAANKALWIAIHAYASAREIEATGAVLYALNDYALGNTDRVSL